MNDGSMRPLFVPVLAPAVLSAVIAFAHGQPAKSPYPEMAPLDRYLIPDRDAEIALARTAAPPSISGDAEVMVLGRNGYTTAAEGHNGFLCLVERSWGASTPDRDFWNPKTRSPVCFNAAAARTYVPIYLLKTRLVLAGTSKTGIVYGIQSALDEKKLAALEPGAMAYMMSKQQYLSDEAVRWHPHLMFFVSGDSGKTWGADLPGSPVMAANDPEEGATIFLVWVSQWSDGTPGPPTSH